MEDYFAGQTDFSELMVVVARLQTVLYDVSRPMFGSVLKQNSSRDRGLHNCIQRKSDEVIFMMILKHPSSIQELAGCRLFV